MRNESNDFKKGRGNNTKTNVEDVISEIEFIDKLINKYTEVIEQNYKKVTELTEELEGFKKEGNIFKNRSHKKNITDAIKFLKSEIKRKQSLIVQSEKLKEGIQMDDLCKLPK
jgi:flagellar biosynthesis chaperone FliJ